MSYDTSNGSKPKRHVLRLPRPEDIKTPEPPEPLMQGGGKGVKAQASSVKDLARQIENSKGWLK